MRMHIGFSFKPKTLLVVLVVILGLVGFCVDAFADPLPEDGGAQLLTDETSDPRKRLPVRWSSIPLLLPKLPRRRRTPTSVERIPALPLLLKASSVTTSPSWLRTAPVMSPLSPASPV